MLCAGDDDFDENKQYLKYDYSLSCTAPEYLYGWKIFAWFMVCVYPVGIPCTYLFLVYRSRPYLNPEPWFIVADVEKDGEFSEVEITEEMKELAKMARQLRDKASVYRIKGQVAHNQEMESASDKRGELAQSHRILRRALSIRDHTILTEDWEVSMPTEAATGRRLDLSAACLEQELIKQHREANPRVALLNFLVRAYEPRFYFWESVECVRRLALTGLLVFFGEGIRHIVVASFIALASLYLYSQYRPYEDDALDTLASVAQLMIFIEVFVALLLRADIVLAGWLRIEWVSGIMIAAHLAFGFYSTPMFPLLVSGVGKVSNRKEDAVLKVAHEWGVSEARSETELRPVWKALAPSAKATDVTATDETTEGQANDEAYVKQQRQQAEGDEEAASILEDAPTDTDPPPSPPHLPPPPPKATPEPPSLLVALCASVHGGTIASDSAEA